MSGNTSGVEVYLRSLLEKIFLLDKQNYYILWWNSHQDVRKNIPNFQGRNVIYLETKIPNKLLNLSLSFFRYPKIDQWLGKKVNKKIDCIFVPDPRPTPISKNCIKVMTFHDLSFEHFKKTFSYKTRLWHNLLRPKKEAFEANKIIAVSEATKQDLIQTYHLPEEKIQVIYEASALNSKINLEECKAVKKKYVLPEKFILSLSTLEPRKNIERLLMAFQKLKQETDLSQKLIVAGKDNPKIFSKLKINKQVQQDILFIGFVEEKEKACLYKMADLFVYPSLFEGFGLPLVEAMQMGCPIVTSNLSVMPEIVGEAAQFVDPYQINSIQDALKKVLSDGLLSEQLRQKSIERSKNFSWEKCARETLDLILNFRL